YNRGKRKSGRGRRSASTDGRRGVSESVSGYRDARRRKFERGSQRPEYATRPARIHSQDPELWNGGNGRVYRRVRQRSGGHIRSAGQFYSRERNTARNGRAFSGSPGHTALAKTRKRGKTARCKHWKQHRLF